MGGVPGGRPRNPVVNTILVLNLVVFSLWIFAALPLPVLAENFLVSWTALEQGRFWTLITSVFSHNWMFHLLVNMIVLMSFGPPLEWLMGPVRFLAFYLGAGVVGSFAHALVSNVFLHEPGLPALGASSALAGVLLLFSLTFPRARVLLFFVIPLPAIVAALGFVAIDIWGLAVQIEGGGLPIGHGAHLGGALTGFLYFVVRRKTLRRQRALLEPPPGPRPPPEYPPTRTPEELDRPGLYRDQPAPERPWERPPEDERPRDDHDRDGRPRS